MTLKSITAMEGLSRTPRAAEMIEEVTFMLGSARLSDTKKEKEKEKPTRLDAGRMLKENTEKEGTRSEWRGKEGI